MRAWICLLAASVVGCSVASKDVGHGEARLISDGAHGGNPHFFFLSPLVPAPSPTGVFDAMASPTVRVCPLDESGCGPDVAVFTMDMGPGSETVRVDAGAEQFIVNWNADNLLSTSDQYRIRVLVDGRELGYADVQVIGSAREAKNLTTEETIALVDGRMLPIKFRIEEGALVGGDVLATGTYHSCEVRADGTFCWGWNAFGQLGDGTLINRSTRTAVVGDPGFVEVTSYSHHTCGLTADGEAWCWGRNHYGQLGTGTRSDSEPVPVAVATTLRFRSLAAGAWHTCGVALDGSAHCWGYNWYGQLGDGTFSEAVPSPTAVSSEASFDSIAAGHYHTCGVTTDARTFCWGYNRGGPLGVGYSSYSEPLPLETSGGVSFVEVTLGNAFTCARTEAGTAYCWGGNGSGVIGQGSASAYEAFPTPTPVLGDHSFVQIDAGTSHNCGIDGAGRALCWGGNGWGELGQGYTSSSIPEPTPVPDLTFTEITAGGRHTCARRTDGQVSCWGRNSMGQLGHGTTSFIEPSPVDVL